MADLEKEAARVFAGLALLAEVRAAGAGSESGVRPARPAAAGPLGQCWNAGHAAGGIGTARGGIGERRSGWDSASGIPGGGGPRCRPRRRWRGARSGSWWPLDHARAAERIREIVRGLEAGA